MHISHIYVCVLCVSVCVCCGPTTVGVPLFSRAGDLVAIFVHTPTLASAAMTLGGFEVALLSTARNIRAWRQQGHSVNRNRASECCSADATCAEFLCIHRGRVNSLLVVPACEGCRTTTIHPV